MKGEAAKLVQYMEGSSKRFVIPVYQRNYDWKIENCKQLYEDLLKIIRNGRSSHFFGSIVSVYDYDSYGGEYLIIDLSEVQKRDNELYERIKETVDANNIIPYMYHTLEQQQKPGRAVGEKLYLIKFDDPIRSTIDMRNSHLVQLKVNPDQTCSCEGITFSSINFVYAL